MFEERGELIGVNSVWQGARGDASTPEVRVRYAARCADPDTARRVVEEVEGLYLAGPAGGGGAAGTVREVLAIASTLIPVGAVRSDTEMLEVLDETA